MKTLKILFFVLLGMSISSCSVSEEDKVRNTAEAFLEALGKYDFKEAASYCDESTKQLLLSLEELMKEYGEDMASLPKSEFNIKSVEINNNEASVTYLDDDGKPEQLYLIKVDDEWKVSIDKEDLNKEELDKEE